VNRRNALPSNFEEVASRLHAAALDAVGVLHVGLFHGPPGTRIRAALAILSLGKELEKIEELERRLNVLERRK